MPASKTLEDGRDAAEKHCTPLACAVEHCLQQHKYQNVTACQVKWETYVQCVKDARERLGLNSGKQL